MTVDIENPPVETRRVPDAAYGLILGAVAALAPIRAARPLQGHMGQMDMQMDASRPPPAICQLLGSTPVVIPAMLANAGYVAPFLRVTDARALGELVIEVGPVDIPARGMPAESRQLVYQLTQFPLDAWVHAFGHAGEQAYQRGKRALAEEQRAIVNSFSSGEATSLRGVLDLLGS